MPLYYLDSGSARGIRLYAFPNKDRDKTYLCSNSNIRDAAGNWKLEDGQCFFRNESNDSNRFQIVREKDGWVAAAHDDYVVFHPPEDDRDSWFVLEQKVDYWYGYLRMGDKWICIGDRYDDGVLYVNLKGHGYWALGKRSDQGKGIMEDGDRLSRGP